MNGIDYVIEIEMPEEIRFEAHREWHVFIKALHENGTYTKEVDTDIAFKLFSIGYWEGQKNY